MEPYLATARRYWWLLAAVLVLVWGSGLALAVDEYLHTYQSEATIWTQHVLRRISPANDPSLGALDAPAAEQSDVLAQLLQTRTFLTEIILGTSLRPQYAAAADQDDFVAEVGRRFRVQRLGTNLVRVSYRAPLPGVAAEMVQAALDARLQRATTSRVEQTSLGDAFLQRELEVAKSEHLEAQRQLDQWVLQHRPPLDPAEELRQRQLTMALELAESRRQDVQSRIDRAPGVAALQQVAESMDFQVIDSPRPAIRPSGGTRPAATIAGIAGAIGLALVAVIIFGVALLPPRLANEDQLAGPSLGRILAGLRGRILAAIAAARSIGRQSRLSLRDTLASEAFDAAGTQQPTSSSKR